MKAALLDVNVLTALLWPAHEHHEAAHRWFGNRGRAGWATCSITQLGFVRIVSNPAFSRDALSPEAAIHLLAQNLAHPAHEFWIENIQLPTAVESTVSRLQGYRQLTDVYLLTLAHRRKGVLATFDRGVSTFAGKSLSLAVEVVPTQ